MTDTGASDGEFDLIARYFAPLSAKAPGAFELTDDAAEIALNGNLVISCDAVVEGVHFLATDPLDQVAQKALRVNLSDLAAKGTKPIGWLLTLAWPKGRDVGEIAHLARGFEADVSAFDVPLLGGDTVSTPGPLMLSVTVLGQPYSGKMVRRAGVQVGDLLCVTGSIGDAALGLAIAQGDRLGLNDEQAAALALRYRVPQPRVQAARAIARFATAALDVSDGLVADAGHLAKASEIGLVIYADAVPLSPAAQAWLDQETDREAALARLITGGDDYEILFTIKEVDFASVLLAIEAPVTVLGRCCKGAGVRVERDGQALTIDAKGWVHF